MKVSDLVRLTHAKKAGKGRWLAKCPSHPDSHPSLSIREGKRAILLKCWSGCELEAVTKALGLRRSDLWYENGPLPDEVAKRLSDERYLANLEYRGALAYWLSVIEPGKCRYWQAAHRRMRHEYRLLWCEIYPVEALKMRHVKALQARIRRIGFDGMWKLVKEEQEAP